MASKVKKETDTVVKNGYSQEEYEAAKKRVKELKEFYTHLTVFVTVMVFLLIINLITSPGYLWVFWPFFGWGIGLVSHGLTVAGNGMFNKEWEEKKIAEVLKNTPRSKK